MKSVDMQEELFHGCSLNEVAHQETDVIGSQYLGSELNRL